MDATIPQNPAGPITPDEMDRLAAQAACAIMMGAASRASGHAFIAGLLYYVAIPEQVAATFLKGRSSDRGSQSVVDLSSSLRALMASKVMLDENGESVLDPAALATGASFAGFCRKFLTTAARSEHRNLTRTYRVTPVRSVAAATVDSDGEGLHVAPTGGDYTLEEAASTYEARARACPPLELVHLQAETLARALGLPRPERPATASERTRVLSELADDPKAAWRAVRDQVDGDIVATPLGDMFAGCRMVELEVLADSAPEVVEVLARSAASDVPPRRQRIVTELSHRMLDPLPRNSRSRRLASETLRRWLTKSSTIVGDEFARGWEPKSDERIADEAAEFARAATMLILDGCFPEFGTVDEVDSWMLAQAGDVEVMQAEERLGRDRDRAFASGATMPGMSAA